jgi:hypothetical protein
LIPAATLLRLLFLFSVFFICPWADSYFSSSSSACRFVNFILLRVSPLPVTVPRSKKSFVANKITKWTWPSPIQFHVQDS